ncbi:MAG: hypothetical protein AAGB51_04145 [Planctomycetota bacterium]
MTRLVLVLALCLGHAQSEAIESYDVMPVTAVAGWVYDPLGEAAEPAWEALARTALASNAVGADTAGPVGMLLGSSALARHPHRVHFVRRGFDQAWSFWLEIDASPVDQQRLLRSLRAILRGIAPGGAQSLDSPEDPESQRPPLFPGRLQGVAFREPTWDDGFEVFWTSEPERLLVSIGHFRWREDGALPPAWCEEFRKQAEPSRPGLLELYADVDAMRRLSPDGSGDRLEDMLRALSVPNAQALMIRAWDARDVVRARALWSPRNSRIEDVRQLDLAEAGWPVALLGTQPGDGGSLIVLRQAVMAWLQAGLRAALAFEQPGVDRAAAEGAMNAWVGRCRPSIARLAAALGPVVAIADEPGPPHAMPLLGTALVPLRGSGEHAAGDLGAMLEAAGLRVVRRENASGEVWSVALLPERIDLFGILRGLSWTTRPGPSGPVLILGWTESSLKVAEGWLAAN